MRVSKFLRRSLTAVAAMTLPAIALAGPGVWTSNGPYGGFTYRLVVNPTTPSTLYSTGRGGVFKSVDGGASWQRAQNGIVGSVVYYYGLMLDREAPDTLLTVDAQGRVVRTTDGANNWALTGFAFATTEVITTFADAPGGAGTYYAVTSGNSFSNVGRVLKSTDGGTTFTALGGGLPANQPFISIAVDPTNANRILVGTDYANVGVSDPTPPALWRSTDGGATWTSVYGLGGLGNASLVESISWGAGTMVYAIVDGQLMRSSDDGATWQALSIPTIFSTVTAHPTLPGTVYLGGPAGYYVSTNADAVTPTYTGPNQTLSANPSYTDTTARIVQARVTAIVPDPNFPTAGTPLYAVTEASGLFKSLDGGTTWSSTDMNQGMSAVNVRALAVHPNPAFMLSQRRIYAGFGDAFSGSAPIYRSPDGGNTWPTAVTGLRGVQIRAITLDPTTTGTTAGALGTTVVYATGRSAQTGLPGNLNQSPAVSIRNGGIYRSLNGGATWSVLDAGLPRRNAPPNDYAFLSTVRSVIVDPRSCGSDPTPVTGPACTTGPLKKVFFTSTGFTGFNNATSPPTPTVSHRIGYTLTANNTDPALVTWINREAGLPQPVFVTVDPDGGGPGAPFNQIRETATPVPIVMDPTNSDTLYVGTFLGNIDRTVTLVPTIANGVFKSTDGGATWTFASNGLPFYTGSATTHLDVLSLAISPTAPGTLWASVANIAYSNPPTVPFVTGLYKTTDGGATWVSSSAGIPPGLDIRAIFVDPTDANRLYASGAGTESNPGAVYRSTDGGANWSSISVGLPADAALALAVDPFNTQQLHAGTNLGVWSMEQVPDADGDGSPDSNESNAPNGGDGNGDGTLDGTQADVGSNVTSFTAIERAAGLVGRGTLATAQGVSGFFTTDIQGTSCPKATDVQGTLAARNGRDPIPGQPNRYYSYPRDLVRFEIPNCAHAVVDITFHNLNVGGLPNFTDPFWSFRIYGPQTPGVDSSMGWYDLGSRAQVVGPNKWRITLDANQFGSYRPVANSILFVGGPAYNDERTFANGFE